MKEVTAKELQALDPKRFEKEYYEWLRYHFNYEWWEYVEQDFTDRMAADGVRVDKILFSLSYSQGDYATFEGRIDVGMWMHHQKYDKDRTFAEAFPALYLATVQDGTYANISDRYRRHADVDYHSNVEYTDPEGVFQHLDEDTWRDLVYDQEQEADLHSNVEQWVFARCPELYQDIRKEYESISDENSFIDACEANEVMFEIEENEDEVCDSN